MDDACAKAVAQDPSVQPGYENWAEKLESLSWKHCKEGCSQGEILSGKEPSCLGDLKSTVCQGPDYFLKRSPFIHAMTLSQKNIISIQDKLHFTIIFVQLSPTLFKIN